MLMDDEVPYLFGNVFSIFSEDSAPNENLAGFGDDATYSY